MNSTFIKSSGLATSKYVRILTYEISKNTKIWNRNYSSIFLFIHFHFNHFHI